MLFSVIFLIINDQFKKRVEEVSMLKYRSLLEKQAWEIGSVLKTIEVIEKSFSVTAASLTSQADLDSLMRSFLVFHQSIQGVFFIPVDTLLEGHSTLRNTYWHKTNDNYAKLDFHPLFINKSRLIGDEQWNSLHADSGKVIFYKKLKNREVIGVEIEIRLISEFEKAEQLKGGVYLIDLAGDKLFVFGGGEMADANSISDKYDSLSLQLAWSDKASEGHYFVEETKSEIYRFIYPLNAPKFNKEWVLGIQLTGGVFFKEYYQTMSYLLIIGLITFLIIVFVVVYSIFKWKKDQDERHQMEILLNSSYAQLLSYMEGSEFVNIYSLDRNYCYLNFNSYHRQEIKRAFNGIPKKGMNMREVLPEKLWQMQKSHFDRVLAGEHFMTTVQEKEKFYQQIFNPIYDTTRGVIGLTCSFINITDKVIAQRELENYREHLEVLVEERTKELRIQKEFFQMLIDQVPNQVFVRDSESRYVLVNKASVMAFDMTMDELVGKTLLESHHNPEEAELYLLEDQTILENDIVVSYEDKVKNRAGNEQWVIVNKTRIKLLDQYFVMGVLMDISHLKDTENRLQDANVELSTTISKLQNTQYKLIESEKMASLGQLMGGIAHEINNPINFVAGNVRPLMQDFEDVRELIKEIEILGKGNLKVNELLEKYSIGFTLSEMESLLTGINEGAKRIGGIVTNLKNFAKPSLGEFTKYEITEGLNSTINLVSYKIRNRIRITTDYQEIPLVICMPAKINQVFLNLLNNAIQAIENKGEIVIKIKFSEASKMVHISIADSGSGIPDEFRNKVFDPFFTTKDVGKGTGLGLSLSFSIIQQHNGEITFEPNEPSGTIFHIRLPVHQKLD